MHKKNGTRRSGVRLTTWILASFAGFAASALAQNTVQNPNFTSDLAPWTPFVSSAPDPVGNGTAVWTATQDANAAIGISGAAQIGLDANPASPHAAAGIHQCIPFAQTTVLQANYGARFKVPASDASDGSVTAAVEIRFFSDAACSQFISGAGGMQGRAIVANVPDDNTWYSASDPSFTPPPGTSAQSAEVRASLRKTGDSATAYTGYFDDIFLSLNGSVPVSLQSFNVD